MTDQDENWDEELDEEEYRVLRERGTEPRGTGEYLGKDEEGIYRCKACGAELFDSETKFDSENSGWPSFFDAIKDNIELEKDDRHGMHRTEVLCSECGSHLGHVFDDGPEPTGKRFCINSVCLSFDPE